MRNDDPIAGNRTLSTLNNASTMLSTMTMTMRLHRGTKARQGLTNRRADPLLC
jgi:hypothetical protein